MKPSGNDYADALRILDGYYRELVSKLAEEIRANTDQFEVPLIGNAESLLERFASHLQSLGMTHAALTTVGENLWREKSITLGEGEYLCFACRKVMTHRNLPCPHCGWTWTQDPPGRWLPTSQKFTQRAHHALELAAQHARRLGHQSLEPEHVLLGLLDEKEGLAAKAMADLGVAEARIFDAVKPALVPAQRLRNTHIQHAKATEQILVDAWAECKELEHGLVSTGHLLLGMTRLIGESAQRITQLLGVDLLGMRRMVLALLKLDATQ